MVQSHPIGCNFISSGKYAVLQYLPYENEELGRDSNNILHLPYLPTEYVKCIDKHVVENGSRNTGKTINKKNYRFNFSYLKLPAGFT